MYIKRKKWFIYRPTRQQCKALGKNTNKKQQAAKVSRLIKLIKETLTGICGVFTSLSCPYLHTVAFQHLNNIFGLFTKPAPAASTLMLKITRESCKLRNTRKESMMHISIINKFMKQLKKSLSCLHLPDMLHAYLPVKLSSFVS